MRAVLPLLYRMAGMLLALSVSHAAFADPPGRVGRLADVQGQVWLYDAEAADWVAAGRNRPLTTGDRVSTDANARAEVRIGSTTLRLAAGTEVELLQLDDDRVRVQLHNGWMALRLRTHESAREVELVTAEGRFKPDRAGRYRLDRVDATTSVTVWSGQLLFEAPDNAATLVAGQRADIWNNGRTQYTLVQPQRDAFADEVAASEQADERSVSAKYVSPEMTGVEDLDRHGRWENDNEYGALWVPRAVEPGWAPYRFGHWAWVRPWGWTWVDDAPWGFAPFHYGRWVFRRNNWCWSPGTWVARPVYAPALVAWVGAPGVGVSVTVGGGPRVGWFPLGPREVFVPGYRTSPRYVRNVNVTQVTNITNVTNIINSPNTVVQQTTYINRGVPGAVTVVPANVVRGRQPVAPARVQITDPRPGRGGHDLQVAALPTVTATAPVQQPAPWTGQPGRPPRNGEPAAPRQRPTVPGTAPPGVAQQSQTSPGIAQHSPAAPGVPQQNPVPSTPGQPAAATVPPAQPGYRGGARPPAEGAPTERVDGVPPPRSQRGPVPPPQVAPPPSTQVPPSQQSPQSPQQQHGGRPPRQQANAVPPVPAQPAAQMPPQQQRPQAQPPAGAAPLQPVAAPPAAVAAPPPSQGRAPSAEPAAARPAVAQTTAPPARAQDNTEQPRGNSRAPKAEK